MKLTDAAGIKKELLERAKSCNYIAASVEEKYVQALHREY